MANYVNAMQQLYVAYYNRPADPAGLQFWTGVVEASGGNTAAVSAAFSSSQEYIDAYGGKDNRTVVNTVYHNLFGRDGEKAGVDYWAAALDSKIVSVADVVTAIASGAVGADLAAYNNKVKFATAFTEALNLHPEQAAYNGKEALAQAKKLTSAVTTDTSLSTALANMDAMTAEFVQISRAPITFSLTAGADTGLAFKGGGGDDVFQATGATLSAGDSLHGGGGVNSLSVNDEGAAFTAGLPGQVKLENIQKISIGSKGSVGGATAADLSGFAGVQEVSIATTGGVNLKVGTGTTTVSIANNTAAATVTGKDVTALNLANTKQAATLVNSTADHTLALGVAGVTAGATITDATAKTVNLKVDVDLLNKGGSDINLAASNATTLNIAAYDNLHLTTTALAAADKLSTLTLKGLGAFSADLTGIAPLANIDASQSSGANTWKVASIPNLVMKGGSGADDVVLTGALANSANIQLGAGDDHYDFSQLAQSGAKVDGGTGKDTIVINDSALLGTSGEVVYNGFETLDFSSGKGLYDLGRVGEVTTLFTDARLRADVEFTNGRANSTISMVSQETNLDLTGKPVEQFVVGQNIKFSLKDASGASDKLTISMTALDSRADGRVNGFVEANTVEANGIETITIHSTVSKVEADNPATATNEGRTAHDYVNSMTSLKAEGVKTVAVTGDASLDLHLVYSTTMTTFDASGSSGDMYFDGLINNGNGAKTALNYIGSQGIDYYIATQTGVNFTGNGGRDTVDLYRYDKVKDVIKFNSASDSIIKFATATSKEVLGQDTIFYFQTGVDKIDLSGLHLANGANRGGIAHLSLASNTTHILESTLKGGVGVFNDNGVNRSLLFAQYGSDDGFMLVDSNGDGNYTDGVDMLIDMINYAASPAVSDFIF